MKKLLALLLAAMMVMALCACGSSVDQATVDEIQTTLDSIEAKLDADTAPAEEAAEPAEEAEAPAADEAAAYEVEDGVVYNIGICQLMQHDALDAATQGFEDALVDLLGEEHVNFDLQNAQGDSTTCSTIVTGFVANNVDLILANATPALQAAVAATSDIPIMGTSVTDYATALDDENLDPNAGTGINVSGTSDGVSAQLYADMVMELVPDAQNVSMVYCSAEANSVVQCDQFKEAIESTYGVTCTAYTFADSNDMQAVITSAIEGADALYIPTDNTAASNMTIVANVCEPAGIPVICGEENMTSLGGLATVSITYYDIGYLCGEMAAEVLAGGADISTMPIGYSAVAVKEYNPDFADAIGFEVPDDYAAIVTE